MDNLILRGYTKKVQPVIVNDKLPSAVILIASILLCGVILFFLYVGTARADVVSVAQSQIGLGEVGGNNKGMYVRKYLNGQEGLPWCAGFVSWCVREAGYDIPYLLRAKSYLKYGEVVNDPQPGDIVVFSRKGGGHVGIIERVTKDKIISIEGNLGAYPSKIKRVIYKRGQIKNLLGFVRLSKAGRE